MYLLNKNRLLKITIIINLIFIISSAYIIYDSSPNGYEVSLYTSIPVIAWILLLISIISGIIIAILSIKFEQKKYWILGLLIIFLSGLIITTLPLIRGYYFWGRGDPTTHIDTVINIINNGHVYDYVIYPISHIEASILYLYINISISKILIYTNFLLIPVAILGPYIFARKILFTEKQKQIFLTCNIAIFSWMSSYFFPMTFANSLIPLFLFIFFMAVQQKCNRINEYNMLLILMVLFYVPLHPVAVLGIVIYMISFQLYNIYIKGKGINFTPIIIAIIAFTLWISKFYIFTSTIRNISDVFNASADSNAATLLNNINYAVSYGYNPIEMFFKVYSYTLIILLFALIALIIIIKRIKIDNRLNALASLYPPIVALIIATGLLYLINIGFGPDRMLYYAKLLCVILMAFILGTFLDMKYINLYKLKLKSTIVIIFTIISISTIYISTIYPSQYLLEGNDQYTYNEKEGIMWVNNNVKDNVMVISLAEIMKREGFYVTMAPYHFYYENNSNFGSSINVDKYYISNKLDKMLYTQIWPSVAKYRWYPSDFNRLDNDCSVNKLYINGETEVYLVKSIK